MFRDGFAESFTLHRIMERHAGCPFSHARTARSDVDPAQLQAARNLLEPLALFSADQIVPRHAKVLEYQFSAVDRAVAKLLQFFTYTEAVSFFTNEKTHALMPGRCVGVCFSEYRQTVAIDSIGDPRLGAVQDIVIAVLLGH